MANKKESSVKDFQTPIQAVYKFYHYDKFARTGIPKMTNVEVLGQSEKQFKIRLLTYDVDNHKKGDIMLVSKSSIIFPKTAPDYTDAPWNND